MQDDFSTSEPGQSRYFPTFKRALEPKRWRQLALLRAEARTFSMLKRLETELTRDVARGSGIGGRIGWLLKHRADFRRIFARGRPAVIKLYLSNCPAEMVPLAIWLWGRSADRFRLYGLAAHCHDPSPQIRKLVAKSLRRLEAWSYLHLMADAYPDDAQIQWYAKTPTRHRSFAERLKNFRSSMDDSHAGEVTTPSQMPFWAAEAFWSYTPPKSVFVIRRMLRRIQHWVRWGVS